MSEPEYRRRAARVLLLDGADRLLLFEAWRDDSEVVYPLGLADLVTDLLAGRRPTEPVRLPWQHPPDTPAAP